MPRSKCNSICANCTRAHNGLNGRFCFELGVYVEHRHQPQCGRDSKQVESLKQEMRL